MKYVCDICGYVYDPEVGDPDNGVAPGTPWEEVPEDWVCPLCGGRQGPVQPGRIKEQIPGSSASGYLDIRYYAGIMPAAGLRSGSLEPLSSSTRQIPAVSACRPLFLHP